MVVRPPSSNAYEFVIVASLRAHQLMGGCVPRVAGEHKLTTKAQMEVAAGRVARLIDKLPAE
jgi:DNA-directed RNA polymerase subunit K/omega